MCAEWRLFRFKTCAKILIFTVVVVVRTIMICLWLWIFVAGI